MKNQKFVKRVFVPKKIYFELKKLRYDKFLLSKSLNLDLQKFILKCKKELDKKNNIKAIIISLNLKSKNISQLHPKIIFEIITLFANYIGKPLIQNSEKEKYIKVYDRGRNLSMYKGARYHQTREGGSIHTDNVNLPYHWDYLLFGCLSNAKAGGESILVDSTLIHLELSKNFKVAKSILEKNFFWEKRGVADELYKAPILTYDLQRKPIFRYLRPYLEAAYFKMKKNLTKKQLYALDVLDGLLESQRFQFRYKMQRGDLLFNLDSKVLHGRTSFSDSLDTKPLKKIFTKKDKLKRTMVRVWIKKYNQKKYL